MKIVDVAEFYTDEGGGVKTYINHKLKAATKSGHEMVVIAPGVKDREEKRFGGRVIWVKGPRLPLDPRYVILWRKKRVHEILDREKPDVVEGSSIWSGGNFVGSWKGSSHKSLIFHQDPVAVYPQTFLGNLLSYKQIDKLFGFFWRYIRRLSSRFDTTIVSGNWLKQRLSTFGVKNPVSVPFGIDKQFFSPSRRDSALRERLLAETGLPPDGHLMICVSRFHPEKRISTIIDGVKEVSKKKDVGLIIYGSGPIEKWIKWKVKDCPAIRLMGFTRNRDELANIMASSDYFIHGSSAETFGLVVAEAICSGLPLVVPDRGGAVDLADPSYAEIYRAGDTNSLSEALLSILSRNRTKLSEGCRNAAEHKICTVDEHFEHLFSFYEHFTRT